MAVTVWLRVLALGLSFGCRQITGAGASPTPRLPAPPLAAPPRRAIVACDRATLYAWPSPDAAPFGTSYPAARRGEAVYVTQGPVMSLGGLSLYETTIDVVAPWGAGKHYWLAERCANVGGPAAER